MVGGNMDKLYPAHDIHTQPSIHHPTQPTGRRLDQLHRIRVVHLADPVRKDPRGVHHHLGPDRPLLPRDGVLHLIDWVGGWVWLLFLLGWYLVGLRQGGVLACMLVLSTHPPSLPSFHSPLLSLLYACFLPWHRKAPPCRPSAAASPNLGGLAYVVFTHYACTYFSKKKKRVCVGGGGRGLTLTLTNQFTLTRFATTAPCCVAVSATVRPMRVSFICPS